jgi:hypothetical protein
MTTVEPRVAGALPRGPTERPSSPWRTPRTSQESRPSGPDAMTMPGELTQAASAVRSTRCALFLQNQFASCPVGIELDVVVIAHGRRCSTRGAGYLWRQCCEGRSLPSPRRSPSAARRATSCPPSTATRSPPDGAPLLPSRAARPSPSASRHSVRIRPWAKTLWARPIPGRSTSFHVVTQSPATAEPRLFAQGATRSSTWSISTGSTFVSFAREYDAS